MRSLWRGEAATARDDEPAEPNLERADEPAEPNLERADEPAEPTLERADVRGDASRRRNLWHGAPCLRPDVVMRALLALAVLTLYVWSAHFWIDVVDEGYFLDLANRVEHGALPYRDFSTYYTPGIFYLFAGVLKVFGPSILPIRYLIAGVRTAAAVLMFGLTRRVAPWPWALAPVGVMLALDHWPIEPEPHPSWPAIVACLATIELVARHDTSPKARWLVLAGATAAMAFAFKQNVGAFTALGVAGYIVLRPRVGELETIKAPAASTWDGAGVDAVGSDAGAELIGEVEETGIPAGADGAASSASTWDSARASSASTRDSAGASSASTRDNSAGACPASTRDSAGGASPASIALRQTLRLAFGLLLAGIVTLFLWPGLDARSAAALWAPSVLGIATATLLGTRARATPSHLGREAAARATPSHLGREAAAAGFGFAAATAAWLVPLVLVLGAGEVPFSLFLGSIDASGLAIGFDDLSLDHWHVYLPGLAAWAGLAALLTQRRRGIETWYVLFGVLALLAMYPRADSAHALVASPPVLVVGAWALAQVRPRLLGRALVAIPLLAVAPQAAWRADLLLAEPYAPLGLDRAEVWVPRQTAEDTRGVVDFLQANTPASAPVFVYPAAPLLNFLADRPNPSRFDHFFPGTLSPADFATIIRELQLAQPQYVIWDHRGVIVWGTDPANRPLSDYLWTCYQQVAAFDLYLVLERRSESC